MRNLEEPDLKSFKAELKKLTNRKIILYLDKFLKMKIPLIIKDDLRKIVQREFLRREKQKHKTKKLSKKANNVNVLGELREREKIIAKNKFEEKRKARIADVESKKSKSNITKMWEVGSIINNTWGKNPFDPPKQEE